MKYLIVTADDLGLTRSVNEGIAKACSEGIVTAVSVIPTGEAFDDAANRIKELGLKEVGAHLSLTETQPLLRSSRFIKNHNELFFDVFTNNMNYEDVYIELEAQLKLIKNIGAKITHINSHEHIHMLPALLSIFIRLAKEFDIPAIRLPAGDRPPKILNIPEIYRSIVLKYFSRNMKKTLAGTGLISTDHFRGLLDAGKLDIDVLLEMINGLKEGVTELVCHPAFLSPELLKHYSWHKNGEAEIFALTDKRVKSALEKNNVKLITYGEFLSNKKI